jgi:hypothetical protein
MVIFQRDGQKRVTGFILDSDPVRDLVFKKNGEALSIKNQDR